MITEEELDQLRSLPTHTAICWAFNALRQVKQESWRIDQRVEFLTSHLGIKRSNAKIETYGYYYNRGDRAAARVNWKSDRYARPDKSMELVDETTAIDF